MLFAGQARGADTGNGSKNFSTPQTVPNYFSNEAGPMLGPASETQRGPLYMGQTYGSLQPAAPSRPVAAVGAPSYRQRVAMAEPRGRLIRGRRLVPHHVAVHGHSVTRVAAHGSVRMHTAYVARHASHASHAVGKATTRVSTVHRHLRG
jgi:hypothetical protein